MQRQDAGPGKRTGAVYNFAPAILRGERVEIAENRSIDLLYVQDAAEALAAALETAGAREKLDYSPRSLQACLRAFVPWVEEDILGKER